MKFNELRRTLSGAALSLAMLFTFAIATSGTAQAQYRDYDRYGRNNDTVRWDKERTRQYAYVLGYHNAYTEAGRTYRGSYRDMAGYRNDANGWLSWMGYRDDYRSQYRRGYEQGFNDSRAGRSRRYNNDDVERILGRDVDRVYRDDDDRYGRGRDYDRDGRGRDYDYGRGRSDVYRIAQENGYRDGIRQGQDDANRRRSYNYTDDSRYRDASSGYRSEYGNRDAYRQAYRQGYSQGYEEGYRSRGSSRGVRLPWPF